MNHTVVHAPASPDEDTGADLPLRENGDFRILLVGQGISSLGDAVSFTALPLLVLMLTGSGVAMAIVGVLTLLPDLLVGLLAGALADRWDRRRMMFLADLGRGLLTAAIPLAHFAGLDTMAVILIVTVPISTLRVLFMAAYTAAVPMLVGPARIGPATSYFEAVYSLGFIAGPSIAGLLAGTIGAAETLLIDGVSFLVSAASLFLVTRSLQPRGARPETHIVHEIWAGIRFVIGHRVLRSVLVFWTVVSVVSAPLIAGLTFYVTVDRGLPTLALGLIISAFSVGSLVGALVSARLTHGRVGRLMVACELLVGIILLGIVATAALAVMIGLAFVAGIASSIVAVSYITLRAASSPNELLGRVGTTARTVSLGLQPMGMLAGGVLLDAAGGAVMIGATGVLLLAVALTFGLSRTLRDARATPQHLVA